MFPGRGTLQREPVKTMPARAKSGLISQSLVAELPRSRVDSISAKMQTQLLHFRLVDFD